MSRKDVFQERASAVYVPAGESIVIAATSEFEGIVVSTPAKPAGHRPCIPPGDVRVNARGQGNYAREVHDIFVTDPREANDGGRNVQPGRATGAAFHRTNTTAETANRCSKRCITIRISPPQGFGQQLIYTADGECAIARRPGRRRGAAAVRLSSGVVAARLPAVLLVGDGRRRTKARAPRRSATRWMHRRKT